MLRRVLTAYLAFLAAAAPCLCCCTTGRLVAAAPPATPAESPPPCCCHDADPAPPAEPRPAPPQPPEQRCPCRDHAQKQATAVIAPAESSLLRATLSAAAVQTPVLVPPAGSSPAAGLVAAFAPSEPFLTASDLLDVHHRLRC